MYHVSQLPLLTAMVEMSHCRPRHHPSESFTVMVLNWSIITNGLSP